jgi:hypothetical protein
MTQTYQIRWLKPDNYTKTAKHFAHYCVEHAQAYANSTPVSQKTLDDAIKLVLSTLQDAQSNNEHTKG